MSILKQFNSTDTIHEHRSSTYVIQYFVQIINVKKLFKSDYVFVAKQTLLLLAVE